MKSIIPFLLFLCSTLAYAGANEDLLEFSRKGYLADVLEAIKRGGVDVNHQDADGNAALHLAAIYSHPEVIAALTSAVLASEQLQLNLQNKKKATPLYLAARNCLGCVIELLKYRERLNLEWGPIPPLAGAIIDKNDAIASQLLMAGARTDITITYQGGKSEPILFELPCRKDAVVLTAYLKAGGNPHLRDAAKRTALMYAALCNNVAGAQALVAGGASLNLRDGNGNTALHLSSTARDLIDGRSNQALYDLLVARGADTSLKNDDGRSAAELRTYVVNLVTAHGEFARRINLKLAGLGSGEAVTFTYSGNALMGQVERRTKEGPIVQGVSTWQLKLRQPIYQYSRDRITLTLAADFNKSIEIPLQSIDELEQMQRLTDLMKQRPFLVHPDI